ncbi:hypothetical protein Dimus_003361 [Dionaea muscipula]
MWASTPCKQLLAWVQPRSSSFIGEAEPRGQQPLVASSASLSGQLQGSFMQRAASKLRAHHPTAGSTAMGIIASSCEQYNNTTCSKQLHWKQAATPLMYSQREVLHRHHLMRPTHTWSTQGHATSLHEADHAGCKWWACAGLFDRRTHAYVGRRHKEYIAWA